MPELDEFLRDLASASPVPGGGSVAALQTAMAAALLVMVSNLTLGRKRYVHVQDAIQDVKREAEDLLERAKQLATKDVEAYQAVADAMSLAKETEEERERRGREIQDALKGAVGPPLEIMQVASETLVLAGQLVSIGNRSAVSDVGTAALAARSGYHAAALNVEINLASIRDDAWVTEIRRSLSEFANPDVVEQSVMTRVGSIIRGESE